MIEQAASAFFTPARKTEEAHRATQVLRRCQVTCPVAYDTLVEAKVTILSGHLPSTGGLEDQPGSLSYTLEWLSVRGTLDARLTGGF